MKQIANKPNNYIEKFYYAELRQKTNMLLGFEKDGIRYFSIFMDGEYYFTSIGKTFQFTKSLFTQRTGKFYLFRDEEDMIDWYLNGSVSPEKEEI